jgi:hypothetical protein
MKKAILGAAVVCALLAGSASAAWKPGTSYYVTEQSASDALEKAADFAFCDGISRFGKTSDAIYDRYRVFDCTIKLNDLFCVDVRVKSVKAAKVRHFQLVRVNYGTCV